ncbi:sugar ABC transporter substrate-binding protein [Blautia sp. OF03-15BH]|uniref:sugar ABC transporter substrate-binding protein n=1 Tax=Blautia sp. OF03-15BH TaxID=2292287 RepID=UPI000E491CBC|nr:substrate-binding domain-containing protein [Blautia sp. OF03-15BH]RGY01169.1 sugar ABC transporter substrate-binding protein [Blautia sp. OF03-15BH]
MKRLRKWKLIAIISSVLCSVLPIAGVQKAEAATPRIAGILSSKSTYWQEILRGIEDGCKEEGLSFFDIDISLQDQDAMTWNAKDAWNLVLMSGADVIIADGNLPDAEVVEKAREKGMKIILVDSDAGKELRDVYVGTDNRQAGYLAVETLDQLYGIDGGAVVLQDNEDVAAVSERFHGICEALKQKWPEVEIKFTETPWYSERMSNFSLEELLMENSDIQAIFGLMESETTLYAQILKQKQLEQKVHLITFDRSEKMVELLEEGAVDAIVVQQSYEIGHKSAEIAACLAKGEVPEEDAVYIDCSVISQKDLPLPEGEKHADE